MSVWPVDDDEFAMIVDVAIKGRHGSTDRELELLGGPDVVARTVAALDATVARIDEQLDTWVQSADGAAMRERARDRAYKWLVWFRMKQAQAGVPDG